MKKTVRAVAILALLNTCAYAQEADSTKVNQLKEVVISDTKFAQSKEKSGKVIEVICDYLEGTRSGQDNSGLSVKGTIHWIAVPTAIPAEIRLYDRLFKVENPSNEEGDFKEYINNESLQIVSNAWVEPSLSNANAGESYQFIRKGYFTVDQKSSPDGKLVFNRTVTLKDAWAKEVKKK